MAMISKLDVRLPADGGVELGAWLFLPEGSGAWAITMAHGFGGTKALAATCRLASTQLDRFEALLDCADTDLFDWIFGGSAPPPEHDHDVMRLLRDFRVRRRSRHYQYGQFPTATTTQE
jgi:hypothetical protein